MMFIVYNICKRHRRINNTILSRLTINLIVVNGSLVPIFTQFAFIRMILCTLLIISWLSVVANGHSSGSPRHICLAPYPRHDTKRYTLVPQSNDRLPYIINVQPETYSENSTLTIIIKSNERFNFRGILLTIKPKTEDITNPVGTFLKCNSTDIQYYNFESGKNSCLTQSSNIPKPGVVECTYLSPLLNYGTLMLSGVFVLEKKTFWINVEKEIQYEGAGKQVPLENPSSSIMPNETITMAGCGIYKNCILFPSLCYRTNSCQYMVSFAAAEEFVDFELVGPDNDYVSLGISTDTIMKDDLVVVCSTGVKSKGVNIQTGYTTMSNNKKRFRITVDHNVINKKGGKMRFASNKLSIMCRFRIPKLLINPASDVVPTNLELPLYIFIAHGNSYPGTGFAKKHNEPPLISTEPVRLYSQRTNIIIYFKGIAYHIQIHGTLMTLAFVIFQPIALMCALHFRNNLQIKYKNKPLWFNIHIVCNLLHCLLTIIGYFYMVAMKNFTFKDAKVHGSVGTVSMILTIINIIMGFTRPDLNSNRRRYFYWAHYINGITIRLTGCKCFMTIRYRMDYIK